MGVGFSQANSRELQGTPSPPLDIYDPNPGPYFVFLDRNGELPPAQIEFIDKVVASWSASNLRAFSVCYSQATDENVDWTPVKVALDNVSAALKKGGAQVVVVPTAYICNQRSWEKAGKQSYVQITGVIQIL
jgi:hypothetical protein